jgi:hypothetical protein
MSSEAPFFPLAAGFAFLFACALDAGDAEADAVGADDADALANACVGSVAGMSGVVMGGVVVATGVDAVAEEVNAVAFTAGRDVMV